MAKKQVTRVGLVTQQVGLVQHLSSDWEHLQRLLRENGQYVVTVHNKHIVNICKVEQLVGDEAGDDFVITWGITVQAAEALQAAGYKSRADVENASDAELLAVTGVGPGTLKRIRGDPS